MAEMGLNAVALAHLKRHKGRSILIVVGLGMAVAAFVAVTSLVLSLQSTLDGRLARYGASLTVLPQNPELSLQYGGITVATAGSGQAALLEPGVLASVEGIPSKARLAAGVPVVLQAASVFGADYLVIGTDIQASAAAKPWWQVEGALPAHTDEVLLGINARNKLRADPGTTLTLWGKPFMVAGVLRETGGEEDNAILVDRGAVSQAAGSDGGLNMVEVAVTDSGVVDQVVREIRQAVPGVDVRSVKQSLEFNARAGSSMADIGAGATALIVIVAVLIVVLTMLSAVRERQKEIGVFRAVGFRRRHVVSLIFRETLLLSAVSAVAGIGLGLAAAALAPHVVAGLDIQFGVNPTVLAAGVALAVALGVLASIYPATVAARLDPAAALKKL